MKKLLTTALCVLATLSATTALQAQNNQNAYRSNPRTHTNEIGLRLGPGGSITYKHYTGPIGSFEIMADVIFGNPAGLYLTGLYEWNHYLGGNGFSLFYGVGAHIGAYAKEFAVGIDGIVGVQYKFPNAPFALSLDWKPQLNFVPDTRFYAQGFALGIKYAF